MWRTNGGDSCECLLSQSDSAKEDFILGAPVFRSYTLSLDYYDETIAFYDKKINSPVVPGGDGSGSGDDGSSSSDGLDGVAIFFIIFAVALFVAAVGCGAYFAVKKKNRSASFDAH